jgi:SAM-dependent methyltransferase
MNLVEYRSTLAEEERTADLVRMLPKNRQSVLDVGARDGHFSRILVQHFPEVVALDLAQPAWSFPGVRTVAGNVTALQFPDASFDCVFCAEVLEHVTDLQKACTELMRVAKHEILIGVPFKQDTRVDQMTCRACGRITPAWGHLNTFDQGRLRQLFADFRVEETSFVGRNRDSASALSAAFMTAGGNPWGPYDQEEPCVFCGAKLQAPREPRPLHQRVCSAIGLRLQRLQSNLTKEHGNWIHIRFRRT